MTRYGESKEFSVVICSSCTDLQTLEACILEGCGQKTQNNLVTVKRKFLPEQVTCDIYEMLKSLRFMLIVDPVTDF